MRLKWWLANEYFLSRTSSCTCHTYGDGFGFLQISYKDRSYYGKRHALLTVENVTAGPFSAWAPLGKLPKVRDFERITMKSFRKPASLFPIQVLRVLSSTCHASVKLVAIQTDGFYGKLDQKNGKRRADLHFSLLKGPPLHSSQPLLAFLIE